jgi:hypothetical protein
LRGADFSGVRGERHPYSRRSAEVVYGYMQKFPA